MSKRVIVFSSHSIYVEGIVNRLRQHPQCDEVHFVDSQDDDFIRKVVELQPSTVIIDTIEEDSQRCVMCELLNTFTTLNIIRLKVQKKDVQVILSKPHELTNVKDLIDLIDC